MNHHPVNSHDGIGENPATWTGLRPEARRPPLPAPRTPAFRIVATCDLSH